MACQNCKSNRIVNLMTGNGRSWDFFKEDGHYIETNPSEMGLGTKEDISFNYCLNCGQIQGIFPVPE